MAATPTTKSQVQAYRFVLKRMESALVRRDAVMLHDPMRTHVRAGIVGLCLALVALAGVFIFGFFKPKDAIGEADQILIGNKSGAVYVLVNLPTQRLIPVTNLASARLVLIRQKGVAAAGAVATERPRKVDDNVLKNIPREPLAGIPGAPLDIPSAENLVEPTWSLCDTTTVDRTLPEQAQLESAAIASTAVIGLDQTGRRLGDHEALLVRSAVNGKHYLVYQGKRAEVDLADGAVTLALNLGADTAERRPVSNGLLNAIPEVPALVPPRIPDNGQPLTRYRVQDHRIGAVVRTERAEGQKFYVLLASGRQEIPPSVANLIRARNEQDVTIPAVPLRDITEAPEAAEADRIRVDDYPSAVPVVLPVRDSTVACLYWAFRDGRQQTAITVADRMVLPGNQQPVKLAQADSAAAGPAAGRGEHLDFVFVPPGRGAAVRAVVPGQPEGTEGTGTIFLVTDLGVKYGVPSVPGASSQQLAGALGLGDLRPAPEAVLRLLPNGAALDPDAVRVFDAVPVPDGAGGELPVPVPGGQPAPQPAPGGGDGTTQGGG